MRRTRTTRINRDNLRPAVAFTFTLFVIIVLCLCLGCASRVQHVTNIPTDASGKALATEDQVKRWDAAIVDMHYLVSTTTVIRTEWIQLNRDKVPGFGDQDASYATGLTAIGKASQIEINATQYLQSVPKSWSADTADKIRGYMTDAQAAFAQLNTQGTVNVDPSVLSQVQKYIQQAISITNLILSFTNMNGNAVPISMRQSICPARDANDTTTFCWTVAYELDLGHWNKWKGEVQP